MRAIEVFWQGHARVIREAAEAWREEHEEALFLIEWEDMVGQVLPSREALRSLLNRAQKALFDGTLVHVIEAGRALRGVCESMAKSFEIFASIVADYERRGYTVKGTDELRAAAGDFRRWREQLEEHWPSFDETELHVGAEQAARGEFVSTEEIYREFPELRHQPDA